MKKLITALSFFVLLSQNLSAQNSSELRHADYLFFLHNRFTEEMPPGAEHIEYGRSQYMEIVEEFTNAGFILMTEKRPAGTDINQYGKKITFQIDSLLKLGIPPNHITVVGISKGGYIAQIVSTLLANPNINFVFIGCFRTQDLVNLPNINYCGNIMTIYERSDEFGVSAIERKRSSKLTITRFKEIELNTGLKHGFLFRPLKEWISPTIMWGKRKYGLR